VDHSDDHANGGPQPPVLVIRHDDADLVDDTRRAAYERAVDECGCDPADVMEVRIGESKIEVDVIDFTGPEWRRRTIARPSAGDVRPASEHR
jgi:hypothetical protein